ncbi:YeaH/YhbH family protein [Laribacter hongkongensis]|uniref:YeaH/YhbH family protein n=1 Tax=Laribacter hongkongensis TaxID=168471 RepID=UPI001EFC7DCB|nr:YeaH/YhbH family protein [Laribacter hongkongensis]MCG9058876.1 YeaH/YhbH family protein [Laribacter hongkongensis]MCG9087029.1 YeaH/YhbH family protein [Laribacter hongkongensis]
MSRIIDRRLNGKNKSAVNRERFLRRFKTQIKESVSRAIKGRSITDIDNGELVTIPAKDLSEPAFHHGNGGVREVIHPGNEEFVKGDKIPRTQNDVKKGQGDKAGNGGDGTDDFIFQLNRDEFLNVFFEDLALPNLVKTQLMGIDEFKSVRAGVTLDGTPSNINIIRSLRSALSRRVAIGAPALSRLRDLQEQLDQALTCDIMNDDVIEILRMELHDLRRKVHKIPFLDPLDLRFNNRVKLPMPTSQAVMFCVMDVSGSMDESKKDIAKRFFIILYLFLRRQYQKIELVFVRHHTSAVEVNEHDFFHSRESGGTVVSSALQLVGKIIASRFPTKNWNIYCAQASDGDNWDSDSASCGQILGGRILPLVQYYAYIEITDGEPQNLWYEYLRVKDNSSNFAMEKIRSPTDIYPVFRELFKKQSAGFVK